MEIKRTEGGYKITDLYITAALLCSKEYSLLDVEPAVLSNGKKYFLFVVKGDPDKLRTSMDDYFNANYKVDAYTFMTNLQNLRSRLFAKSER